MTTTQPVGTSTTSATSTGASTTGSPPTVDYQSFLKLLITEMKNQDPTNPMDSTQYMAQLAAFSNVEQATLTNSKLDQLLSTSALSQADSAIGRTLTSADGATTGTVTSVTMTSTGLSAKLDNGQTVAIGPGVVVS
jgi:flagellar basal-body rod modification protein FlgD